MSESKDRKLKQLFKRNFRNKIEEITQKVVDDKVQKKLLEGKEYQKMVRIIARQRDIVFLIACGLLISNIIFVIMWLLCK